MATTGIEFFKNTNPQTNATMETVWTKVFRTNPTSSSFTARIPQIAAPSGDGVISVPGSNWGMIMPVGVGSANDLYDVRAIGWRPLVSGTSRLWIPYTLVDVTVTLGTQTGVAGGLLTATDLFADTVAAASTPVDRSLVIPGLTFATSTNENAKFYFHLTGHHVIEFQINVATATSANLLLATL